MGLAGGTFTMMSFLFVNPNNIPPFKKPEDVDDSFKQFPMFIAKNWPIAINQFCYFYAGILGLAFILMPGFAPKTDKVVTESVEIVQVD